FVGQRRVFVRDVAGADAKARAFHATALELVLNVEIVGQPVLDDPVILSAGQISRGVVVVADVAGIETRAPRTVVPGQARRGLPLRTAVTTHQFLDARDGDTRDDAVLE